MKPARSLVATELAVNLRFTILTQYFSPEVGAPQIRLLAIAKELSRLGHAPVVVTALPNYPHGKIFSEYRRKWLVREVIEGVPTIRTWIYPARGRSVLRRLVSYWSFTLTSLLGCQLAPRPDYILVESPPLFLGLTAYIYSRVRDVPFILYVSDLWPASAKELGFVKNRFFLWASERLAHFLYRTAYKVCGVTKGICTEIEQATRDNRKVVFMPNGVDLQTFRVFQATSLDRERLGEIVFIYAGTHGFAQGLDVIIEAARELASHKRIAFLLVGDGPDKARLERLASDYRLANVRFLPARPAKAIGPLFSASRASIVPLKRAEIFRGARPSKILPSLACGVPVIFCGEGEAAALIEDHNCGLVVRPERPDELAIAVTRLAEDSLLASRLGMNGRKLAEMDYGWDRIVARWLSELVSE